MSSSESAFALSPSSPPPPPPRRRRRPPRRRRRRPPCWSSSPLSSSSCDPSLGPASRSPASGWSSGWSSGSSLGWSLAWALLRAGAVLGSGGWKSSEGAEAEASDPASLRRGACGCLRLRPAPARRQPSRPAFVAGLLGCRLLRGLLGRLLGRRLLRGGLLGGRLPLGGVGGARRGRLLVGRPVRLRGGLLGRLLGGGLLRRRLLGGLLGRLLAPEPAPVAAESAESPAGASASSRPWGSGWRRPVSAWFSAWWCCRSRRACALLCPRDAECSVRTGADRSSGRSDRPSKSLRWTPERRVSTPGDGGVLRLSVSVRSARPSAVTGRYGPSLSPTVTPCRG